MVDAGMDFLYGAYTAVWLGWFLYLIYLYQRQSRLEKDMHNLKEMVKDCGNKEKKEE